MNEFILENWKGLKAFLGHKYHQGTKEKWGYTGSLVTMFCLHLDSLLPGQLQAMEMRNKLTFMYMCAKALT